MTSPRVNVKPALYRWAYERNRLTIEQASERFPHLTSWIGGETQPTLKQLEAFAKAMHAGIGNFFADAPPDEPLPIHDFRTVAGKPIARPSPDLLETLYACQMRQSWFQDFAEEEHDDPLDFVGSAKLTDSPLDVAAEMRARLAFDLAARRAMSSWTEALRQFIAHADDAGVLVMCSGIVGSDTHRKLDPEEFRGFALVDPVAPLVFVNGADTKSAQMFTLAHELAHVWLGATGVSNVEAAASPADATERWCDQVAAELLVPLDVFASEYHPKAELQGELARLARVFKVSTLVVLRRMHDAGGISRQRMWDEYRAERARLLALKRGTGGDFYLSTAARVSKRFARALIVSTWEGRSTFSEAFRLLGVRKMATFRGLSDSLGMAV